MNMPFIAPARMIGNLTIWNHVSDQQLSVRVHPGQLIVGHDMYISLLLVTQCVPNSRRIFVQKLFTPLVTIAYCIILPMLVQSVYTLTFSLPYMTEISVVIRQ